MKRHTAALVALALPCLPAALAGQEFDGCWAGTIASGADQRRAALELVRAGGVGGGAFHVLGRHVATDSLANVSAGGDEVAFTLPTQEGAPAFRVRAAGDSLSGEATRGSDTYSVRFARVGATPDAASTLIGYWFGWLQQAGSPVLRIGLDVAPAPCGQVIVTMDSPDQGAEDLPITSLSASADSLRFEIAYVGGAFRGAARAGGDSLVGRWSQGGGTLDLLLARTDSAPSAGRPQEPEKPFPYDEDEVTYENPTDGTRFAGTLTVPEGEGPFPAALMITGSGAQNRDEAIMGHRPFLVIADYLTRHGVAVLRVDDRGVGGSSGNVMQATIADNAGDARAGVSFLATHPKVDAERIGLIGHSEGGWVAPAAAARSDEVAFIVTLAGPAVTGEAIRHAQDSLMLLASGLPPHYITANRTVSAAIYAALRSTPDDSLALVRMVEAATSTAAALPAQQRAAWDSVQALADTAQQLRSLRLATTVWFRYLLDYDPVPHLREVDVPVLALYGAKDLQVPPHQSVPVLRDALAHNPDVTIRVFPELNHLFQHAETGLPAEYGRIEETFAPEALEVIARWIKERFESE